MNTPETPIAPMGERLNRAVRMQLLQLAIQANLAKQIGIDKKLPTWAQEILHTDIVTHEIVKTLAPQGEEFISKHEGRLSGTLFKIATFPLDKTGKTLAGQWFLHYGDSVRESKEAWRKIGKNIKEGFVNIVNANKSGTIFEDHKTVSPVPHAA